MEAISEILLTRKTDFCDGGATAGFSTRSRIPDNLSFKRRSLLNLSPKSPNDIIIRMLKALTIKYLPKAHPTPFLYAQRKKRNTNPPR